MLGCKVYGKSYLSRPGINVNLTEYREEGVRSGYPISYHSIGELSLRFRQSGRSTNTTRLDDWSLGALTSRNSDTHAPQCPSQQTILFHCFAGKPYRVAAVYQLTMTLFSDVVCAQQ
ncbi:hypothetical protein VFPPC_17635 [Pochonia chlamydosporia 170]|uniref:Uncharacterized protein n=1 Tax=Pochonia chlamydosporia 170 TaxID=1380566 RepID=A0A219ARG1_METCM|nr:hypothetical protein VFPPC_17635 [Pochonia chlamydosporia 170]OWT43189.1 hypothetical protein VFPPC_17635 [Pochonia chlamydosporia 170]